MRERTKEMQATGRYMGIDELKNYISLGEGTARKIGAESGAVVRIGRRVLYDRQQIDAYMESFRGQQATI